jgi:dihydroxyacetone kinase-like protein
MSINTDKVRTIIKEIAKVIEEQKEYLSDLDRAIGDGDHGYNLARGFETVVQKLNETPGSNIGEVLKTVAMSLISNVGGASGALYGTMFLKASVTAKDISEIDLAKFVLMLNEGVAGIQVRGKAVFGEKTMLDVLIPVLEFLKNESSNNIPAKEAFEKAEKLAAESLEKTKDIIATKGRASYLGERSIGHIDPGAASSYFMILTIKKAFE